MVYTKLGSGAREPPLFAAVPVAEETARVAVRPVRPRVMPLESDEFYVRRPETRLPRTERTAYLFNDR